MRAGNYVLQGGHANLEFAVFVFNVPKQDFYRIMSNYYVKPNFVVVIAYRT